MEFAGLKCEPEVNASGYCALPAAHPRLTWLCDTHALTNIPTITLVALPMQYAKLLFFFSSSLRTVYLLSSFHLWLGCFCGITVSALLF